MNSSQPWKPRLAPKARLKVDAVGGQELLLFPEAALALSETAAAIVRLCDGERTTASIIDALAQQFSGRDAGAIGEDVHAFLASLRDRGLVE